MPYPRHRPHRDAPAVAAVALAAAAVAIAACTPTFNWRDVRIADEGLVALLPCKADRATRAVSMGSESVEVEMAGCEAGGATFAVAHAAAADAAQADAWLRAWQKASRAQMGGSEVVEAAATLPRASLSPAPWKLMSRGAADAAGATHILWFSQRTAVGVSLYQATVLGRPSSPEAVAAFFEGLRLP